MQPIFTARTALFVTTLLMVAACGKEPPPSAFLNRGGPESLLDVSSEVVNLSVASPKDRKDLSNWIEKDQPTRAELNCASGSKNCNEAEKILDLHGVPVAGGNGADQTVTLVYQRILARDCNQRFIDLHPNHYNAYHPAYGCSVSANMVQEVTDKQEFVSPNLADDPRATRAVSDYTRAFVPRPVILPYGVSDSTVNKGKAE